MIRLKNIFFACFIALFLILIDLNFQLHKVIFRTNFDENRKHKVYVANDFNFSRNCYKTMPLNKKSTEYVIPNNQHVFLNNLKEDDIITMPTLHGCTQVTFYQSGKALVIHFTDNTPVKKVENLINNYIHNFDKKGSVSIDLLFPTDREKEKINIEKMINNVTLEYFNKAIPIHETLFKKRNGTHSNIYFYRAKVTKSGLKSSLNAKKFIIALRASEYFYGNNIKKNFEIKAHDLQDECIIGFFADDKLFIARQYANDNILKNPLLKNFNDRNVQISVILPEKYSNKKDEIASKLKENFSNIKNIKYLTYSDITGRCYYSGIITSNGLKNKIKKYEKGELYESEN